MRTGWDRWDKTGFAVAGGLVGLGLVQAFLWGYFVVGVLLAIEGLLIGAHRAHLRSAHNYAWIMGRAAMLGSLAEALRRGMRPLDFVIAEAERDGALVRLTERRDGAEPEP